KLFSSKESSYLIWDSEIVQIRLISILCGQASICQIPFFIVPLFQSAIIEQFQIILNDKRNNIIFQAFFKHNQSTHSPIAILKRMDSLKLYMEVQNIFKCLSFLGIILHQ